MRTVATKTASIEVALKGLHAAMHAALEEGKYEVLSPLSNAIKLLAHAR